MNNKKRRTRKRMQIRMIIIATGMTVAFQVTAQEEVPQNFSVWTGWELYLPLHEGSSWGLFTEAYVKRVNFLKDPQGLFWRLGASYYLKNGNRLSGGVAWQYNYPYDAVALPYSWPDWRLWQQYMIRHVSARNKEHLWVHRLRLEERWFGRKNDPANDGYDYYKFETTFRYMLRSQWYIKPRVGVAVYDEIHLRVYSEERDEKIFDQNRIYAGLIYALDKDRVWRVETGYMFHSMWNAPESEAGRERINHTWRITLTGDVPLSKK